MIVVVILRTHTHAYFLAMKDRMKWVVNLLNRWRFSEIKYSLIHWVMLNHVEKPQDLSFLHPPDSSSLSQCLVFFGGRFCNPQVINTYLDKFHVTCRDIIRRQWNDSIIEPGFCSRSAILWAACSSVYQKLHHVITYLT